MLVKLNQDSWLGKAGEVCNFVEWYARDLISRGVASEVVLKADGTPQKKRGRPRKEKGAPRAIDPEKVVTS